MKFYGNKAIKADYVNTSKAGFKLSAYSAKTLGSGMMVLNIASVTSSAYKAYGEYQTTGDVSAGTLMDLGASSIGFFPGGWVVGATYSYFKINYMLYEAVVTDMMDQYYNQFNKLKYENPSRSSQEIEYQMWFEGVTGTQYDN